MITSPRSFSWLAEVAAISLLLFGAFFCSGDTGFLPDFANFGLSIVKETIQDQKAQWLIFLCLEGYIGLFLLLELKTSRNTKFRLRSVSRTCWLACSLLISGVVYANQHSPSSEAMTLVGGAAFGQGLRLLNLRGTKRGRERNRVYQVLLLVLIFVIVVSFPVETRNQFNYHGFRRWSGPWDNPNIFGLLVGTSVVCIIGGICLAFKFWPSQIRCLNFLGIGLLLISAGHLCLALLCSFSRGALIATLYGIYSLKPLTRPLTRKLFCRVETLSQVKMWHCVGIIIFSVGVLCFWQFQHLNWSFWHRVVSITDSKDLSWKNRVSAWEGALQMMAESPWCGIGWGQPRLQYGTFYGPAKLQEAAAIEMNDYLLMGASVGIPALLCFCASLWQSFGLHLPTPGGLLHGAAMKVWSQESLNRDYVHLIWLTIICRAGASVLAVGFWFDGGLFTLATGATFWVLFELSLARMD